MASLPDDVLLVVISHTDIDTFLNLRLLNRHLHNLISTHIHGLTERVARATFPKQTRVLMASHDKTDEKECLHWLKDLRYHQLAAILLEYSIYRRPALNSAEDPLGDDLRHSLAKGWRVIESCSRIAVEVEKTPVEPLSRGHGASHAAENKAEAAVSSAKSRALETCRRRLQYLEQLQMEEMNALSEVLGALCSCVFGFPVWHNDDDADQGQQDRPGNDQCERWVCSYVLKTGAAPFWACWWGTKATSGHRLHAIKDAVEAAWDECDETTREFEGQMAQVMDIQTKRIRSRIRMKSYPWNGRRPHGAKTPESVTRLLHLPSARLLKQQRDRLTAEGESPPLFALEGVPFKQELDARVIGRTPIVRRPPRNRREVCCGNRFSRPIDSVLLEYKELYEEWERAWTEKQGWEIQLRPLQQIPALPDQGGEVDAA